MVVTHLTSVKEHTMNAASPISLPEPHAPAAHPLMRALGHGLPITLLVDLIDPNGPRSHEMFERETTKPDAAVLTIPDIAEARSA
jgi:hypothetical protein